jgi:elongation factor 1-gamma
MKVIADSTFPAWAISIAAKYAGVNLTVEEDEEVKTKSPIGKGPILLTDNGALFTAVAAARFVAKDANLNGSSAFEAAEVDQWINFATQEIATPAAVWVFPILGFIQNHPAATPVAKEDVKKVLQVLNTHLTTKTFLVGERISLADIVVATALYRLYVKVLDPNFRKNFVHANRWFTTLVNQPEFLAVLGPTTLATRMEVAPAAANAKPKEEKKEKKKAEPKKEEKKPEPKKEEKVEEEDLEALAEAEAQAESKKKNVLDALPPSKLNFDEWKRTYSNEETRSVAIPWFWEHFDPEGYSLYFADYKYNHELEKVFMTCNLLGGFIQRLDKLRKYGFGSMIIFGEEPNLEIKTCWMFRGTTIPQEMIECDDSEHYTWTKVDINNAEQKEQVNNFWAWDGFKEAKPFNQGKVFK